MTILLCMFATLAVAYLGLAFVAADWNWIAAVWGWSADDRSTFMLAIIVVAIAGVLIGVGCS